ncbi:DoxX family protein [Rhodococcus sp. HNM0569]|uniref:DoxX family protein n=1 Tax=Rhodococcus sp. HNM0569 TaxID=2716340 RepID=UPI00146E58F2|nr:DoxX family protein [Rhodococcus sp. HNM0569]NLU84363.1 DoxX family protein [Rhodococcus sp. HNM0569]
MSETLNRVSPRMIAVFRVVVGFLFFCHGASTLFAWPVAPYGGATASVGQWPSWWAGAIELVVGVLLVVGLGTRAAAFVGSGAMAVAYFWKPQPDGLLPIQNEGDSSALFCWSLLLLVFLGPGRLALATVVRPSRPAVGEPDEDVVAVR